MARLKKYPGVQQISDTTFKLIIVDGYTKLPNGNKKQNRFFKTVNAKSSKEAADLRAKWIIEIKNGAVLTNNKMTLREFYEYFKNNTDHLAPKSLCFYNGLFVRIDASLGHKKIDDITPNNIRAFIKNLGDDGIYKGSMKNKRVLSQNTILKYYRMLNMLFNRACKWGLASVNPCERADPPKVVVKQEDIYNEEDLGKFINCLEKELLKYKVMVMITLTIGCRRGETMGLQWKHIDFINKTIKIEQTAQYLTGIGIFIKEPKTHSSTRTVSMPNSLVSLLKAYKSEFNARRLKLGLRWRGGKSIDEDFLFTTWEGRQAHPDSMNSWLKKFVKKNKLQPITPKCFRHMAATYLITSGTDIRTVAGKLGHANTNTTTTVYTHLLKTVEKETAEKMEFFIQNASAKIKEKI